MGDVVLEIGYPSPSTRVTDLPVTDLEREGDREHGPPSAMADTKAVKIKTQVLHILAIEIISSSHHKAVISVTVYKI